MVGRDCGRLTGGVRCSAWLGDGSLSACNVAITGPICPEIRGPSAAPPSGSPSLSATRRASPKALHHSTRPVVGSPFQCPAKRPCLTLKAGLLPARHSRPRTCRDRPGNVCAGTGAARAENTAIPHPAKPPFAALIYHKYMLQRHLGLVIIDTAMKTTSSDLNLGSYHSPSGAVVQLRSPADVHALFQALIKKMPRMTLDKRTGQSCAYQGGSR